MSVLANIITIIFICVFEFILLKSYLSLKFFQGDILGILIGLRFLLAYFVFKFMLYMNISEIIDLKFFEYSFNIKGDFFEVILKNIVTHIIVYTKFILLFLTTVVLIFLLIINAVKVHYFIINYFNFIDIFNTILGIVIFIITVISIVLIIYVNKIIYDTDFLKNNIKKVNRTFLKIKQRMIK